MKEDVNSVSPTLGFIIKTIDFDGYVGSFTNARDEIVRLLFFYIDTSLTFVCNMATTTYLTTVPGHLNHGLIS